MWAEAAALGRRGLGCCCRCGLRSGGAGEAWPGYPETGAQGDRWQRGPEQKPGRLRLRLLVCVLPRAQPHEALAVHCSSRVDALPSALALLWRWPRWDRLWTEATVPCGRQPVPSSLLL